MSCQAVAVRISAPPGSDPDGQLAAEPQLSPTFSGGPVGCERPYRDHECRRVAATCPPQVLAQEVGNITRSSAGKLRSHPTHQTLRCVGQHQLRASSPASYEEDALAKIAELIAERAQLRRWQSRRFGASEPSLRQIDCFGDSLRRRVCRGRHVVRRVIRKASGHSITLGRQRELVVVPARHPTMVLPLRRRGSPGIHSLQRFIRETFWQQVLPPACSLLHYPISRTPSPSH